MIKLDNGDVSSIGNVDVLEVKVHKKNEDLVAIEILLDNEDIEVAAYGDGFTPSIILCENDPKVANEKFSKITFTGYQKFKVWSADLSGDTLRVCLVR